MLRFHFGLRYRFQVYLQIQQFRSILAFRVVDSKMSLATSSEQFIDVCYQAIPKGFFAQVPNDITVTIESDALMDEVHVMVSWENVYECRQELKYWCGLKTIVSAGRREIIRRSKITIKNAM